MDKYDPASASGWSSTNGAPGTIRTPGSNPGFLDQQNSLRDAVVAALNLNIFAQHADRVKMAAIAQMVNVLQAMLLTDGAADGADADLSGVRHVQAVAGRDRRCRSS